MSEPIDEAYFNWLCAKVLSHNPRVYTGLLAVLHRTEFVWTVHEDARRASDGLELREDFLRETRMDRDPDWDHVGCSIFEMILAMAKRAEFQTDVPPKDWFWEIMTNLGLDEYRHISNEHVPEIEDILHKLIWRMYDDAGNGGMFPLRWPKEDQREVEIWYQFFAYIDEKGLY